MEIDDATAKIIRGQNDQLATNLVLLEAVRALIQATPDPDVLLDAVRVRLFARLSETDFAEMPGLRESLESRLAGLSRQR